MEKAIEAAIKLEKSVEVADAAKFQRPKVQNRGYSSYKEEMRLEASRAD